MDMAFGLYATEQMGYLDTYESVLNRAINYFRQNPDDSLLYASSLTFDGYTFTGKDLERIVNDYRA